MTITAVGPHRSNEDRLLHLSSHDGLTGLPNRASLMRQVRRRLESTDAVTALLFLDLDHFKQVNDHLGHRYGDELLRTAARRVQLAIRPTDHVGRLGGDEIGVFCPDVESPDDIHALAARVGQALATPLQMHDQMVIIDASIGIAFSGGSVRTAEQLIDEADRAMYVAKDHGAAVYAAARYMCGAAANRVTEETFWLAWRGQHHGAFTGRSARVALLTIAHRRAMKAALRTAQRADDSARSTTIAAVLRRGQAIERTLACAQLTADERSLTALVVYGRCTAAEVARILNEDEHNVNHRLGVALGRLRVAESSGR